MSEPVKLTAMVKAAGCAAKLNPATLDAILRRLPQSSHPDVLVGFGTNDDAGIYRIDDQRALVQTVDFFTPIVDDPFTFGQIAAANALSDIYAMGGRPISSLTIVGFPEKGDPGILEQIIRGGLNKMDEAQCAVIGGHSIRNEDILFGYAVTGLIDPRKIWRNVGAHTNDILLFTKSFGTGLLATAIKNGRISSEAHDAVLASLRELNRNAAEALHAVESEFPSCIHAVTDVTGFSLLGHAREMALGDPSSGIPAVSLQIHSNALPILPGAMDAAQAGYVSGGLKNNRAFIGDCVQFAPSVSEEMRLLCFDPQTSGGLLIAIDPSRVDRAIQEFSARGLRATAIGRVIAKTSPLIQVN